MRTKGSSFVVTAAEFNALEVEVLLQVQYNEAPDLLEEEETHFEWKWIWVLLIELEKEDEKRKVVRLFL